MGRIDWTAMPTDIIRRPWGWHNVEKIGHRWSPRRIVARALCWFIRAEVPEFAPDRVLGPVVSEEVLARYCSLASLYRTASANPARKDAA